MEVDCRCVSPTALFAQRRTAACRVARVLRGNLLGAAPRRSLEGFAQPFPVTQHLLATAARLDAVWRMGASLVTFTLQPATRRPSARRGRDRRRHVVLGKKGGGCVGKTKRGKGTKIMVLADSHGLPLGAHIASASPHEVTLIEPLLAQRRMRCLPRHLLYDSAADSDPLRDRLRQRGIHLVCSCRAHRVRSRTLDRRRLCRYRRLWTVGHSHR